MERQAQRHHCEKKRGHGTSELVSRGGSCAILARIGRWITRLARPACVKWGMRGAPRDEEWCPGNWRRRMGRLPVFSLLSTLIVHPPSSPESDRHLSPSLPAPGPPLAGYKIMLRDESAKKMQ